MSFYWDNLLTIAQEMIDMPKSVTGEAYYRSAINRAYYAAHKTASEWLEDRGVTPKSDETSHKAVTNALSNRSERLARRAGIQLAAIKDDRVEADYYKDVTVDVNRAKRVIKIAQKVCTDLATAI